MSKHIIINNTSWNVDAVKKHGSKEAFLKAHEHWDWVKPGELESVYDTIMQEVATPDVKAAKTNTTK